MAGPFCYEISSFEIRIPQKTQLESCFGGAIAVIRTPIPFSRLRACIASGELGCRWISDRNS